MATKIPAWYVPINWAVYNTRDLQRANFDNIQVIWNGLYWIPKSTTPEPTVQQPVDEDATRLQASLDYINSLNTDEESKQILMAVAHWDYKTKNKILTPEEITKISEDALINATADISPYYARTQARAEEDITGSMRNLRESAAREVAKEQKSYKELLDKTKSDLRARGLTFSGAWVKKLWAESAIGSTEVEGEIPQDRRLQYADFIAKNKISAETLWKEYERKYGSEASKRLDSLFWTVADPYKSWTTYNPTETSPLYTSKTEWQTGYTWIWDEALDKQKAIELSRLSRLKAYLPSVWNK